MLLHVTLAFPDAHPFSPLTLHTAVAEANLLWSAYNVSIDIAAPGAASVDGEALTVVVEAPRSPAASRWRRPLGAITFRPDGTPTPVIALFLADIIYFVSGARVLGTFECQWPQTMRERILGRVVGRVLAHEIGHYLLRSPRHGDAGLMQPVQFGDVLVGPERRAFALSKAEAARIALASSEGAGR